MKIAATSVSMDAARTYKEVEQRFTGFTTTSTAKDASAPFDDFNVHLSRILASTGQTQLLTQSVVKSSCSGRDYLPQIYGDPAAGSEKILSQLAAQVIGQPITIKHVQEDPVASSHLKPPKLAGDPLIQVSGVALVSSTTYSQEETQLFSAQGTVQTTDGREIAFDLGLSMERNTLAINSSSIDMSTIFIDPLILQFDTGSSLLSDRSFLFDLDGDGDTEQLACPGSGCGFLAFDRNHDGVINNGLELFGPSSGSGFGELAELDQDANQWIDENDPVFDQLLIWKQDSQGGESLQSLRAAGVGAIAVVHAGTAFQMENAAGEILGTLKGSGIFLTESGEVRSLQEVDMALPAVTPIDQEMMLQSVESDLDAALQTLRAIITMQQLRLRMMLTGQRLQRAVVEKEEQREWLFTRQHTHREGQAWRSGPTGATTDNLTEFLPRPSGLRQAVDKAQEKLERSTERVNLGRTNKSRHAPLLSAQWQSDPTVSGVSDGQGVRRNRHSEELNHD